MLVCSEEQISYLINTIKQHSSQVLDNKWVPRDAYKQEAAILLLNLNDYQWDYKKMNAYKQIQSEKREYL